MASYDKPHPLWRSWLFLAIIPNLFQARPKHLLFHSENSCKHSSQGIKLHRSIWNRACLWPWDHEVLFSWEMCCIISFRKIYSCFHTETKKVTSFLCLINSRIYFSNAYRSSFKFSHQMFLWTLYINALTVLLLFLSFEYLPLCYINKGNLFLLSDFIFLCWK